MDAECTSKHNNNDNVKVYVRVRPPNSHEISAQSKNCVFVRENNTVILDAKPPKVFTFDYVADAHVTQEEIFERVGKPIAESCIAGYHGTIFAYGQTGSGKTYTIQGALTESGEDIWELRGLIPRVLECLFTHISKHRQTSSNVEYLCTCSYLEIYNEQITDLLNPHGGKLHIREDIKRGVYVENVVEETVSSAEEAYRLLKYGAQNRHVATTAMNAVSSRSHSVFTLYLQSKEISKNMTFVRYSRLHLIDLAGSERQTHTDTTGLRLKEAGNINKSLSTLGNVIRALVDVANGRERHVPYRDSKLTFLLKDSLGGNSKTSIVATISPSEKCFGETLSTLKFAQRAKLIQNNAVVNENTTGSILQLQSELKRLKHELANTQAELALARQEISIVNSEEILPSLSSSDSVLSSPCGHTKFPIIFPKDKTDTERLLCRYISYNERLEVENQKLLTKIQMLQDLCETKEYFVQSKNMLLRLREARIAELQQNTDKNKAVSVESLQEEVNQLKYQLDHHPEVLRFAVENFELRETLAEYDRMFGEDMEQQQREIAKLKEWISDLSKLMKKVLDEKHELLRMSTLPASADAPSNHHHQQQSEVQRWKYEQELELLRSELSQLKIEHEQKESKWQETELRLEAALTACQQQLAKCEQNLKAEQFAGQLEAEKLEEMPKEIGERSRAQQDVDDLESQLFAQVAKYDQLKQREASLKEENELLLEEADFRKSQVEELQQERAKLEATVHSLQHELQRQEEEIAKLRDTVETQRVVLSANTKNAERLNTLLQETTTLRDEVQKARVEIQCLEKERETLLGQLRIFKETIASLEQQLATHSSVMTSMQTMLDNTREKLRVKEDETKMLCSQLEEKTTQLISLREIQERYEQVLNDKQKLIETFNAKEAELLSTLRTQHEELKMTQQTLQHEHTQLELLRNQHAQLEAQYCDLKNTHHLSVQHMQQEKDQLQTALTSLRHQHEQTDHAFASLQKEYEALVQEHRVRVSDYEALQNELTRLRHLDEEATLVQHKIEQLTTELTACQQRERKLLELKEQWEQWRERRNKEFFQLQTELQQREFCDKEQREQIERMIQHLNNIKAELDRSYATTHRYIEEMRELKAAEEKARKECAEVRRELNVLVEENAFLIAAKKTLEEQVEKLNFQLAQLVSHANHKQKIHHHIKVKQDYNEVRKMNEALARELRRKELLVRRLVSELSKLKSESTKGTKRVAELPSSQKLALEKQIEAAALVAVEEEEKLRRLLQDKETENRALTENLRVGLCYYQRNSVTTFLLPSCQCIFCFQNLISKVFDIAVVSNSSNNHCNPVKLDPTQLTASTTEAIQLLTQLFEAMKQKEANIEYLKFQLDLQAKEVTLLKKLKEIAETNIDKHNERYNNAEIVMSPKNKSAAVIRRSYGFGSPLFNVTVSCVTPQQSSPQVTLSIPATNSSDCSLNKENNACNI